MTHSSILRKRRSPRTSIVNPVSFSQRCRSLKTWLEYNKYDFITIVVLSGAWLQTLHVTSSWKAARVNTCNDGQRRGFVNIKYRLDQVINTMGLRLQKHCMSSYTHHTRWLLKITDRLFQYFTLLTLWMQASAPPTSFTTGAIVRVSFHKFIWHLPRISNAELSLLLQRRSTFVFCNTKLWCLPTNKLALTVTSTEGKKEKKKKSKT